MRSISAVLEETFAHPVLSVRVTLVPRAHLGCRRLGRRRHREAAGAVRDPEPSALLAGLAADNVDTVRDHEGRVEANAELADQRRASEPAVMRSRNARVPERAIVPRLSISSCSFMPMPLSATVSVPADLVALHPDSEAGVVGQQAGLSDGLVAQLVACVGSVGDELAQKHFLLGVDRVDHQMQKPRDLGLKDVFMCLRRLLGTHNSHSGACLESGDYCRMPEGIKALRIERARGAWPCDCVSSTLSLRDKGGPAL